MLEKYFITNDYSPKKLASDYMKMINDMRIEGLNFRRTGSYRCKIQSEANEKVYSNENVMSYYMNALLLSQIFWVHHFKMFIFFKEYMSKVSAGKKTYSILDIGPGHGFFTHTIKSIIPDFKKISLIDISEKSLLMTKNILNTPDPRFDFINLDVTTLSDSSDYDLIIIGEVLEHLDDPYDLLVKIRYLLKDDGLLWFTVPTNAPAIDHIFLFRNKSEVYQMVSETGFQLIETIYLNSENVSEEIAQQNKITELIGCFVKKKEL